MKYINQVLLCFVFFVCGLVFDAYVVEKQIDETGVVELDSKTYTCQVYRGEMPK